MSIQLPYNPNPLPPGQVAPIPVWVPPQNGYVPMIHGFARVRWDPIRRPFLLIPPANTTFHRFSSLPPELRLRIWSFAAPTDRVIEIRSWGSGRYAPIKISVHPHRLPTIFRVCKESRSEARRLYKVVEIGVSAAVKQESRTYVPWEYHPTNPLADPALTVGTAPLPYAEPYPTTKVRICWSRDIVYLGPEFKPEHLLQFFTTTGAGQELKGLQRLALGHKLWGGSEDGSWNTLRKSLWSLRGRRDVREVIIVPDDDRGALVDRWYYGKHDIQLLEPEWKYNFRPNNGEVAKNFVENLEEWFARLWKRPQASASTPASLPSSTDDDDDDEDDNASVATLADHEDEKGSTPPEVSVKSVRRNRHRMADFKDGLWEIQEAIGDMRVWKTWNPPSET